MVADNAHKNPTLLKLSEILSVRLFGDPDIEPDGKRQEPEIKLAKKQLIRAFRSGDVMIIGSFIDEDASSVRSGSQIDPVLVEEWAVDFDESTLATNAGTFHEVVGYEDDVRRIGPPLIGGVSAIPTKSNRGAPATYDKFEIVKVAAVCLAENGWPDTDEGFITMVSESCEVLKMDKAPSRSWMQTNILNPLKAMRLQCGFSD